jgi:hypothetical protein
MYDLRFEQLDLRLEQRFQAQSKSVDAALISADLKSDALADKINQIAIDLKEHLTRAEYESQHKALIDKIDDLRARYYEASGVAAGSNVNQQLRELSVKISELRASRDSASGQARAQPTTAAQIADLASEVRALRDFKESNTGRLTGTAQMYGWIVSAVFLLIAVITFVTRN